jgi:hypothetical protein
MVPAGRLWRKLAPAMGLILLLALAAGCSVGGKVERLVDRARAEAAAARPHPDFVPTPLGDAGALAALPEAIATDRLMAHVDILPVTPSPTVSPQRADAGVMADPSSTATSAAAATFALAITPTRTPIPGPASPLSTPTVATGDLGGGPAARRALAALTPTLPPAPRATPAPPKVQPTVALTGLTHYWQDWNNCGPATLASNLSYYGSKLNQKDIEAVLRPDRDDKNVNPDELAGYAISQGFHAVARVGGDTDRLRQLLSSGIPVIVETWMEPKPNDGMGHYRLLTGYDTAAKQWIAYDSYESTGVDPNKPYAGIRLPYAELDKLWWVFDNTYIVVYTDQQAAAVSQTLGPAIDDAAMWQAAESASRADVVNQPGDAFGWFNLGTDLVGLHNYGEAAAAYDQARRLGLPWRMLWYQFGPFKAYYEIGRFKEMVTLADATLQTVGNIEELHYWRGVALKAQDDAAGARQAWQRALQLNPNYRAPAEALAALGQ